jgi:hypothetical protein
MGLKFAFAYLHINLKTNCRESNNTNSRDAQKSPNRSSKLGIGTLSVNFALCFWTTFWVSNLPLLTLIIMLRHIVEKVITLTLGMPRKGSTGAQFGIGTLNVNFALCFWTTF